MPFSLLFDSPWIDWSSDSSFPLAHSNITSGGEREGERESEVLRKAREGGVREVDAMNWQGGRLDKWMSGAKVGRMKEGLIRVCWLSLSLLLLLPLSRPSLSAHSLTADESPGLTEPRSPLPLLPHPPRSFPLLPRPKITNHLRLSPALPRSAEKVLARVHHALYRFLQLAE